MGLATAAEPWLAGELMLQVSVSLSVSVACRVRAKALGEPFLLIVTVVQPPSVIRSGVGSHDQYQRDRSRIPRQVGDLTLHRVRAKRIIIRHRHIHIITQQIMLGRIHQRDS